MNIFHPKPLTIEAFHNKVEKITRKLDRDVMAYTPKRYDLLDRFTSKKAILTWTVGFFVLALSLLPVLTIGKPYFQQNPQTLFVLKIIYTTFVWLALTPLLLACIAGALGYTSKPPRGFNAPLSDRLTGKFIRFMQSEDALHINFIYHTLLRWMGQRSTLGEWESFLLKKHYLQFRKLCQQLFANSHLDPNERQKALEHYYEIEGTWSKNPYELHIQWQQFIDHAQSRYEQMSLNETTPSLSMDTQPKRRL